MRQRPRARFAFFRRAIAWLTRRVPTLKPSLARHEPQHGVGGPTLSPSEGAPLDRREAAWEVVGSSKVSDAPTTRPLYAPPRDRTKIGCLTQEQAFAHVSGGAAAPPAADVLAHLDKCASCRLVLGEAARGLHESSTAHENVATKTPALTLTVGEVIAKRYEILRFVASGGMGEVYEARDTTLNEVVALKTLVLAAIDDARAVARLRVEVRLARRVTHPNVCRILEFGEHRPQKNPNESIPFLTMEYLRGETLARRIAREGRLPADEVARLLEPILAGLGAVHAAGIIHRDIKPQNIFILAGPPERIVLMDFGLARTLSATHGAITGPLVIGTADYMAPEQVEGRPPNRRFDVYALGAVIFEMLTGKRPFSGKTPADVARERLNTDPPAPSELVPELDPVWDKLVLRCLARDPHERFGRVTDIAVRLRDDILRAPGVRKRRLVSRADAGWVALGAVAALGLVMFRSNTRRDAAPSAIPVPAGVMPSVTAWPVAAPAFPAPAEPTGGASAEPENRPPPAPPSASTMQRPAKGPRHPTLAGASRPPTEPAPTGTSHPTAPAPRAAELFNDMQ
jgi:hypothetical protein